MYFRDLNPSFHEKVTVSNLFNALKTAIISYIEPTVGIYYSFHGK